MEWLNNLAQQIQYLNKKDFQKYISIFLGVIALLIGGMIYYIYSTSEELVSDITRLKRLEQDSVSIRSDITEINIEQERVEQLLEENSNFNIKRYFEEFCKESNINPEAGWDTSIVELNPQFDEVTLDATFKKQSMKLLVTILEKLDKKQIVSVKRLIVKKEKDKTITFDITLATLQKK